MNKVLQKKAVLFHVTSDNIIVKGSHDALQFPGDEITNFNNYLGLTGNCSLISGNIGNLDLESVIHNCDVSNVTGDISNVAGCISPKLFGDLTYMSGNLSNVTGNTNGKSGDLTHLSGDISQLAGVLSDLRGNATGVYGNATNIHGDLDAAEITEEERKAGVDINDLVGLAISEEPMVGQQPEPDPLGIEPSDASDLQVGKISNLVRLSDIDFDNPDQIKSLENAATTVPVSLLHNLLISYYAGGGEPNLLQERLADALQHVSPDAN